MRDKLKNNYSKCNFNTRYTVRMSKKIEILMIVNHFTFSIVRRVIRNINELYNMYD